MTTDSIKRVGAARPSQLLWSYGPGAMIELPNFSAITLGLDMWKIRDCTRVTEPRLLNLVRRRLGPQVEALYAPPVEREEIGFRVPDLHGAPVRPFPTYFRCPHCGLLGTLNDYFELKSNNYCPDKASVFHKSCNKYSGKPAHAMPMRFMVACEHGHIDDFPWRWFVHEGQNPHCHGQMRVREIGSFLQIDNLYIECECGAKKPLMHAFGKAGESNLPVCRGRHPHLKDHFDTCGAKLKAVLLGSSNLWFPVSQSVLAIPAKDDELTELVRQRLDKFEDVQQFDDLAMALKIIERYEKGVSFRKFDAQRIYETLMMLRNKAAHHHAIENDEISDSDAKRPEWRCFILPKPPTKHPQYDAEKVAVPERYRTQIAEVLLVHRLRKVNALLGFTRLTSLGDVDMPAKDMIAPLCENAPTWVPANEIHGEGIFIRFNEDAVRAWEQTSAVMTRCDSLTAAYETRCEAHECPAVHCPDARFYMIHTFAHLLIRELSLKCGYNAASIGERIYVGRVNTDDPESLDMAGVLIYTAAADSDGTLGGLVELGKPENLAPIIASALERARICTADPLCSEHEPEKEPLAAACHSCSFVSETSCEYSNNYLDRALLIPTVQTVDAAFFPEG